MGGGSRILLFIAFFLAFYTVIEQQVEINSLQIELEQCIEDDDKVNF